MPGHVATGRSADLDLPSRADHAARHGVIACFVDEDERAGPAVLHVRVGQHGSARAQPDLTDVVERQPGRVQLTFERLGIGPIDDLLHRRANDTGGVLERVAPADVQRVVAHPADRALELPSAGRAIVRPHQHVAAGDIELISQRERH